MRSLSLFSPVASLAAGLSALLLAACAQNAAAPPPSAAATTAAAPASAAAPAPAAGAAIDAKAVGSQIRFVEDDFAGAVERAKTDKKPLFVDSWATWCHSCLSMQRFVFNDAGLRTVKDAVVWLSIETEQEHNRGFVEKYPADGLPTFLLLDPDSGEVLGRWLGSGTANEMRTFVQQGVQAYAAKSGGPGQTVAALAEREGDAAQLRRDYPAAGDAYRRAFTQSPKGDPARPERLVKLATTLGRRGKHVDECVALGEQELNGMPITPAGADFAVTVAGCAEEVLKADPTDVRARKLPALAEAYLIALLAKPDAPLSADDRSDVLANLADLQESDGRKPTAIETMRRREKLLEAAAAAAPDPATAATFDAHRTDTYVYLDELPKAEALLSKREKEIPGDYNPPARLARVLLLEKKLPEAEAAVDRALGQMTKGPRRIGILGLKAKILDALGKPKEAVLREQLAVLRGLPATQRQPETEAKLAATLGEPAAVGAAQK